MASTSHFPHSSTVHAILPFNNTFLKSSLSGGSASYLGDGNRNTEVRGSYWKPTLVLTTPISYFRGFHGLGLGVICYGVLGGTGYGLGVGR